jgi:hypothetical protein
MVGEMLKEIPFPNMWKFLGVTASFDEDRD